MAKCSVAVIVLIALQVFYATALSVERASGRYNPGNNNGKYVADSDKWAYKPDNRGKYVHVHIPYNGGYGPFENPYDHDGRPYEHEDHPFKQQVFNDPTPSVYREYGAPLFNNL